MPIHHLLSIPLILTLIHLIHRLLLSFRPLNAIPAAHPTASISRAWILQTRYRGREIRAIHRAHAALGPVVRLAPNEISVCCVKGGLAAVYAGGWEKSAWYAFFGNFGVANMFATTGSKPHSARKRLLSNIYSKSSIQASEALRAATGIILHDRLLPLLESNGTEPINILPLFYALTMDFVTARLFGISAGTNFTQDTAARDRFLHWYGCRRSHNFWPQELPRFTACMAKLGVRLVPKFVDEANAEIEQFTMDMCDKADALLEAGGDIEGMSDAARHKLSPNFPTVYAHLATSMQKSEQGKESNDRDIATNDPCVTDRRLDLASEMLDHLAAGFETSGITLTYLAHELSQRLELQTALRDELGRLDTPVTSSTKPGLPSAKALDALPLLQAVLQETLRLHAAIPGPQPRVSPSVGGTLGEPGQFGEYLPLPPDVRVSAQAWSLHRNKEIFPEPDKWKPERWLDSRGKLLTVDSADGAGDRFREMMRWFWAFGSGGRMCVGNNLAIYQMKFIVAAIYTNYTTMIIDDEGIEQLDMYTAPPKSEKLMLAFARA
ncbi:cytochrome P450 [Saccharata proteae CBS 121410]|uniref:Cytochrome P450 n=1 Tax=Saccharata proteae CBS 121410 TaxID=1314787 RepID=A0A6A5YFG9_9PEZI|nr:cytochrome P450 [Saccharata proteae CBS 121410]